ncbi:MULTISPECIES: PPC domain-containing protein [unclassified Xanthomonas]|uniref:PPC domain-containing protein n=1 Tax=unclassified Xanthomonas TaxID=2643310 RepID=UPI0035587F53
MGSVASAVESTLSSNAAMPAEDDNDVPPCFGGSGQASLYVAACRVPVVEDNDAVSMRSGTSQTGRFAAPRTGTCVLKLEVPASMA